MQVEVDMKCMENNFGGHGLSDIRVMVPLWFLFACLQKRPRFPFGPWTIVHGGQKIESAKKFMQVEVDVKCMENNFSGHGLSGIGVMVPFCLPSKTSKISLQTMDYSPWKSKNRIGSKNSCK